MSACHRCTNQRTPSLAHQKSLCAKEQGMGPANPIGLRAVFSSGRRDPVLFFSPRNRPPRRRTTSTQTCLFLLRLQGAAAYFTAPGNRVSERITGGEVHGRGSPRSLPACPLDTAVMTVSATVVRLKWETESDSVGSLKAERPSGEARLPRGPDKCGRAPTVANWTRASSPARVMRPPLNLPGNRRGGREPTASPAVLSRASRLFGPSGRATWLFRWKTQ